MHQSVSCDDTHDPVYDCPEDNDGADLLAILVVCVVLFIKVFVIPWS